MALTLRTLMLWLALICFVVAAIDHPVPHVNFMNLGFAFVTASVLASG